LMESTALLMCTALLTKVHVDLTLLQTSWQVSNINFLLGHCSWSPNGNFVQFISYLVLDNS
jgi:hypothetical protein